MQEYKNFLKTVLAFENIAYSENSNIEELELLIRKNGEKMRWGYICMSYLLPEEFIKKFPEHFLPDFVERYKYLSEDFIEEHKNKFNWNFLTSCQIFSEEFMEKNSSLLDWFSASREQCMSEEFILKNSDKVSWKEVSKYQKLSEKFILENKELLNMRLVQQHQQLSENFIEKNIDWLNTDLISIYQSLSEDFIKTHLDILDKSILGSYQRLSKKFVKEHCIPLDSSNWYYRYCRKEKLNIFKNVSDYEVVNDDYLIAYKGCRIDGYPFYNFQHKYIKGNVYTNHCDCISQRSPAFGLSAGYKKNVKGVVKLLTLKIKIDDIGYFSEEFHTIRCFGFEILDEELIN